MKSLLLVGVALLFVVLTVSARGQEAGKTGGRSGLTERVMVGHAFPSFFVSEARHFHVSW